MHASGSLLRQGLLRPGLYGPFEHLGAQALSSSVPPADDYSAEDRRQSEDSYDEHVRLSATSCPHRPWSLLIPPPPMEQTPGEEPFCGTSRTAAAGPPRLTPAPLVAVAGGRRSRTDSWGSARAPIVARRGRRPRRRGPRADADVVGVVAGAGAGALTVCRQCPAGLDLSGADRAAHRQWE
jgi:hypothetical protein